MGSGRRTARMRSPRPAKGSPGHPAAAASATCRRRGGLRAADSARRCSAPAPPGPPAAARRPPDTGADSRPGARRLPLPASIVCRAAGRGRGEEAGGRKRSGGSAPRTPGPASREGRCRPAAAPGPGGLRPPASSARRVPAPRDCVTGPPRLRPPGPGRAPGRPGDVSASGVAWLPRRSPGPLPLAFPGATRLRPSGQHPTSTPHLFLTWTRVPLCHADHDVSAPLLADAPAPDLAGEDGDAGGTEFRTPLGRGTPGGTWNGDGRERRTSLKFALVRRHEEWRERKDAQRHPRPRCGCSSESAPFFPTRLPVFRSHHFLARVDPSWSLTVHTIQLITVK